MGAWIPTRQIYNAALLNKKLASFRSVFAASFSMFQLLNHLCTVYRIFYLMSRRQSVKLPRQIQRSCLYFIEMKGILVLAVYILSYLL